MTDQEINEAVARKLGWNLNKTGGVGVPPHRSMGFETIPDYCHSIEAAWEIVENLGPQFHRLWRYWDDGKYIFEISDGRLVVGPEKIDVIEGEADTAPMAICKAFLKVP